SATWRSENRASVSRRSSRLFRMASPNPDIFPLPLPLSVYYTLRYYFWVSSPVASTPCRSHRRRSNRKRHVFLVIFFWGGARAVRAVETPERRAIDTPFHLLSRFEEGEREGMHEHVMPVPLPILAHPLCPMS